MLPASALFSTPPSTEKQLPSFALSSLREFLKRNEGSKLRIALLAWGSFEQPFFDATVAVVLQLVHVAQMPAQARTMFRFASSGSLERELKAAGFCNFHERSLTVPRIWAGTPEELWTYQQEVSTLCHPLFESIPTDLRTKVDAEVSSLLARFQSGSVLSVPVNVIVAGGQRP